MWVLTSPSFEFQTIIRPICQVWCFRDKTLLWQIMVSSQGLSMLFLCCLFCWVLEVGEASKWWSISCFSRCRQNLPSVVQTWKYINLDTLCKRFIFVFTIIIFNNVYVDASWSHVYYIPCKWTTCKLGRVIIKILLIKMRRILIPVHKVS